MKTEKVSCDQEGMADADPNKVSYGQSTVESAYLTDVSYDQEKLACVDPAEVSYAVDPTDVSYADQDKVGYASGLTDVRYGQERVADADPVKVSYEADPTAVSYADPADVSYEAESVKVSYGISEQAWKNLAKTLLAAYQCPDPQGTALAILRGWINGYGPTFESVKEQSVVNRIRGLAADIGFREVSPGDLKQYIQSARVQWRAFRGRYWDKGGSRILPLMDVTAPPAPDSAGDVYC